jgi:tetratricopeptide (TPR) repeat protein
MDNIEKLKEKVENDPKSTLFVPLAEEYKKAGQLDEAIEVLKAGIERQPGYMSARVSLGKVYLEKEMRREAKEEFEKVVKAIPDNLFALKKLAEIARATRDREGAVRHYKKLLSLNSMDEESQEILQLLLSGGGIEEPPKEEPEEAEVLEIPEDEEFEPLGASLEELERQAPKRAVEQSPSPEEDDFITSLADKDILEEHGHVGFSGERRDAASAASIAGAVELEAVELEAVELEAVEIEAVELEGEVAGFGEIELSGDADLSPGEGARGFSGDGSTGEGLQDDIDAMFGEPEPAFETPAPAAAVEEATASATASPPAKSAEAPLAAEEQTAPPDLTRADACIAEGDYIGAMDVYRKLLGVNPRDVQVLQKTEELKSLLKLLGKENEVVVVRLQNFLDSIKNTRDEFFGSS